MPDLYANVDTLLAPGTLSALTGTPVRSVALRPLPHVDGLSGAHLGIVDTNGGDGPPLVLKRIASASDWVMRVTGDTQGRAVQVWATGLLDRMPPEISHEALACSRDGEGWAILMRDVGGRLFPPGDHPIGIDENERLLDAMAALNAAFWDAPLTGAALEASASLDRRYRGFMPRTMTPEARGPDEIPPLVLRGWELLETAVDPGVAGVIRPLLDDPAPLSRALGRYPQTFIHGDWKLGNLGLHPGERGPVILLDWAVWGPAPPGVELAWYLAVNSARLPVSKEETIACYREALARRLGPRFDEAWWRPQLELALLGGFLLLGWSKLLGAFDDNADVRERERAELVWWSDRVREGAKRL